jgi:hypothetical protein
MGKAAKITGYSCFESFHGPSQSNEARFKISPFMGAELYACRTHVAKGIETVNNSQESPSGVHVDILPFIEISPS